ncbi:MAG: tRNA (adenosine(37)-N6)-threonylcarbamoyltransferase complex ATPase subunit type 1 TsaE [Bacteroidales bacterium]|nr:tRNA (adenosine(37)-N6)-threonylcarbamoyltransferase complex ATPase subunit type 1 TsaE [Bacteroidales bacterium]
MKKTIYSEEELPLVAETLLQEFPNDRVFCFYGEMGAGKTTFIKVVCQQLGASDTTSSPTFAIINEYLTQDDESIYHFDFYRIEKLADAYEIGVEDYLYSGNYCFLEWPENIPELIQPEFVKVKITVGSDHSRTFETVE